jgi:hypothetical protein
MKSTGPAYYYRGTKIKAMLNLLLAFDLMILWSSAVTIVAFIVTY